METKLQKPIKPLPPIKPVKAEVSKVSNSYLVILVFLILLQFIIFWKSELWIISVPGILVYIFLFLLPQYNSESRQNENIDLEYEKRLSVYNNNLEKYNEQMNLYAHDIRIYNNALKDD